MKLRKFKLHGFTAYVQESTLFGTDEVIDGSYSITVEHNRTGASLGTQYLKATSPRAAALEAVKDARASLR